MICEGAWQGVSRVTGYKAPAVMPKPLRLVGLTRLELVTSRMSSERSNQLSYRPLNHILTVTARRDISLSDPMTAHRHPGKRET